MTTVHSQSVPHIRIPVGATRDAIAALITDAGLHTVCESAACPNRWECFHRGTATFMLMGNTCTRNCTFCNVTHGTPQKLDTEEPARIAEAIEKMGISYAVITSVTRDDLTDGGATHFAATIEAIRARKPDARVEVLIPDFGGDIFALETVLNARPAVLNHNVETVARLTPIIRPDASYLRSLAVLSYAARYAPEIPVKTGLMLGLGETREEVYDTLADIRRTGCSLLTLGQYLAPSPNHAPVQEYLDEAQFAHYAERATTCGFTGVAAGARIRSSYHADILWQTSHTTSITPTERIHD